MNEQKLGQRAVVIGGSISGLLSARVLSDFFNEVVIVEADVPWNEKTPRKRVPQGHHSHVLLESGQKSLEHLFPGFINELIQDGSVVTDFTNDLEWFHFGRWKKRFSSGIRGVQQTRPFLEWHINRRLKDYPNIHVLHDTQVNNLIVSPIENAVKGVRLTNRTSDKEEELLANMVVDASGYGSQILKWLSLDSDAILEEVKIGLFYATRFFTNDQSLDWKNLMVSAQLPQSPYAGVVLAFEEGKFGVTLGGYLKDPPKTNEEFLHIAKSLPVPHIYEFLQKATPTSDLKVYRIPQQARKRLDKVKLPDGIIIVGDGFCRFDPIYGQGMSVAALEAELLSQMLGEINSEKDWDAFYSRYHRSQYKITKNPWDMAITEAFRHPEILGKKPFGLGINQKLVTKIYRASATQEEVYLALANVMNLTRSPNVFYKPSMWTKIFR